MTNHRYFFCYKFTVLLSRRNDFKFNGSVSLRRHQREMTENKRVN